MPASPIYIKKIAADESWVPLKAGAFGINRRHCVSLYQRNDCKTSADNMHAFKKWRKDRNVVPIGLRKSFKFECLRRSP